MDSGRVQFTNGGSSGPCGAIRTPAGDIKYSDCAVRSQSKDDNHNNCGYSANGVPWITAELEVPL